MVTINPVGLAGGLTTGAEGMVKRKQFEGADSMLLTTAVIWKATMVPGVDGIMVLKGPAAGMLTPTLRNGPAHVRAR